MHYFILKFHFTARVSHVCMFHVAKDQIIEELLGKFDIAKNISEDLTEKNIGDLIL